MPGLLTLVVLMSLAAWRATRFIVKDGLIDAQRDWFLKRLLGEGNWQEDFDGDIVPDPLSVANEHVAKWRLKLHELFTCPYCMSVWVSSAVVGLTWIFTPIALPVLVWGATCGAVMAWWHLIEPD